MSAAPACRTTSTDPAQQPRATAGFTLAEVVVALGVAGIIAAALVTLAVSSGRSLAEMINYVDLDHHNRIALDVLTRDVRQMRYLSQQDTNAISFVDQNGQVLTLGYSSRDRTLTRTYGAQTNTLLKDCDFLRFDIFQRTPRTNSFTLFPAGALTNCKVLTVTWSCSRSLFGLPANQEAAQTARIVLRNKREDQP